VLFRSGGPGFAPTPGTSAAGGTGGGGASQCGASTAATSGTANTGGGGGGAGGGNPGNSGAGGSGIVIVKELDKASGVWSMQEQLEKVEDGLWPDTSLVFNCGCRLFSRCWWWRWWCM